jgi:hypothetical protein
MFKDRLQIRETVVGEIQGPKVQPEDIMCGTDGILHIPMQHGNGCPGMMDVYFDLASVELRVKCQGCGARYMVARDVNGTFTRFRE